MKNSHFKIALILLLAFGFLGGYVVLAQERQMISQAAHVMVAMDEIKWAAGPPSLPPGASMAIIDGDPKKEGLFTMRLKFPADYKVPAHNHPADERVTVISGTLNVGMGDKLDTTKGKELPAGSFVVMPVKANHFAWTNDGATIQIHAMGPWAVTYVNPADDPRNK